MVIACLADEGCVIYVEESAYPGRAVSFSSTVEAFQPYIDGWQSRTVATSCKVMLLTSRAGSLC